MNFFRCELDGAFPEILGEKYQIPNTSWSPEDPWGPRRLELSVSSLALLNSLESLGYSVVTSGAFTAALDNPDTFLQREFIWTLHRPVSSHLSL